MQRVQNRGFPNEPPLFQNDFRNTLYEAVDAAQKDMPQLRSYLKMVATDKSLSPEEKLKRVKALHYGEDWAKADEEPDKTKDEI